MIQTRDEKKPIMRRISEEDFSKHSPRRDVRSLSPTGNRYHAGYWLHKSHMMVPSKSTYRQVKHVVRKSSKKISHKLMKINNIPYCSHYNKKQEEDSQSMEEIQGTPSRRRSMSWSPQSPSAKDFSTKNSTQTQDNDNQQAFTPLIHNKKKEKNRNNKILLKTEVWKRTSTMSGWSDLVNTSHLYPTSGGPSFSSARWEKRILILTEDGTLSHSVSENKKHIGSIHVLENRATVSPTLLTESTTPTPYTIILRTKMDMEQKTLSLSKNKKWTICFQSYNDQMTWLSTLSHILLSHNIIQLPPQTHNHPPTALSIPTSPSQYSQYNAYYSPSFPNTTNAQLNEGQYHSVNTLIEQPTTIIGDANSSKYQKWAPVIFIWNLGFVGIKWLALASTGIWIHFTLSYTLLTVLYFQNYNFRNHHKEKKGDDILPEETTALIEPSNTSLSYGSSSNQSPLHDHIKNKTLPLTTAPDPYHDQNIFQSSKETRTSFHPAHRVKKNNYKPKAGSTTVKLPIDDDDSIATIPDQEDDQTFIRWKALVKDTDIQLRGRDYLTTKKKIPCIGQLYSLEHVDTIDTNGFLPNMSSRVDLPPIKNPNKLYTAPDRLVISLSIPSKVPKIGLSSDKNEQGITITMYYVMKDWTRTVLNRHYSSTNIDCTTATIRQSNHKINNENRNIKTNESNLTDDDKALIENGKNSALLWENWCQKAPNDTKERTRFKVVIDAPNLRELGVPSWICKYNAKPFLIKRPGVTGHLFLSDNCLEYDITLFPFPYMFKQAITYLKDHYFRHLLINFAFLIEGRDNKELPECLLGDVMQFYHADPDCVISEEDFFSGNYAVPPKIYPQPYPNTYTNT